MNIFNITIEKAYERSEYWRKKYEDLECHRASCCWEMEQENSRFKEQLSRVQQEERSATPTN